MRDLLVELKQLLFILFDSEGFAFQSADLDVTRNVMRLQSGYLYHYAFAMLVGAAALVTWFMFASPGGAH